MNKWVEVGVRLAVSDAGAGPAVVLLHGWPVTSFHWRLTVPALAAAGFRAICADLRGLGASLGGPAVFAKEALADDVIGLVDRLGVGMFAVVGHDWGGTVGYLVAADHRDRVSALVVIRHLQVADAGRYPAEQRAELVNPVLVSSLQRYLSKGAPRS